MAKDSEEEEEEEDGWMDGCDFCRQEVELSLWKFYSLNKLINVYQSIVVLTRNKYVLRRIAAQFPGKKTAR